MDKWEYMSIEVEKNKVVRVNGRPYSGDFFDQLIGSKPEVWEFLNKLGGEGWEVFEVRKEGEIREFLAKRQKS